MSGARRIVCVGNRHRPGDDAGPRVHDRLARAALPAGVELVDGGLAGVDLARFVDGAERVAFVDGVAGFGRPGEVVRLTRARVAAGPPPAYGHSGGLTYLLHALPLLCSEPLPEIVVFGWEGEAGEEAVRKASEACLAWIAR